MRRTTFRALFFRALFALVAVLAVAAVPLAGQTYTVTLNNGNQWVSNYRPVVTAKDESQVRLLTTSGSWILLNKDNIADLDIKIPGGRVGTLRPDGAIILGAAANDTVEEAEISSDPATRLLEYMIERDANQRDYSVDQFAEPSEAGRGGLPVTGLGPPPGQAVGSGTTSFGVGGSGVEAVEPDDVQ